MYETDIQLIANIFGLTAQKPKKLTYDLEKDRHNVMFLSKTGVELQNTLSFKRKSFYLQYLSAELTENKIKSMLEILALRSYEMKYSLFTCNA